MRAILTIGYHKFLLPMNLIIANQLTSLDTPMTQGYDSKIRASFYCPIKQEKIPEITITMVPDNAIRSVDDSESQKA